jgi:hypothetical protein
MQVPQVPFDKVIMQNTYDFQPITANHLSVHHYTRIYGTFEISRTTILFYNKNRKSGNLKKLNLCFRVNVNQT